MKHWMRTSLLTLSAAALMMNSLSDAFAAGSRLRGPSPGDIFKEYQRANMSYAEWRVTDPNTTRPQAQAYLPNAVLDIPVLDLSHAVRAEAVLDFWGGHCGTTGKAIRFNGNTWISIPELGTPPPQPECYLSYSNITVDIPLTDLYEGTNYFEGTNGGQTCYSFNWGQTGQFGIVVRVYYDSTKAHPTGTITSVADGGILNENPQITSSATSTAGISKVSFVGYYEGFDTDGDGIYLDWQYNFHRDQTETVMNMKGNIGNATSSPYTVTWNTSLVPDQPAGQVKLAAIIRDNNGVFYMTKAVSNLSLVRSGKSVQMYKPYNVPEHYEIRAPSPEMSSNFAIPNGTNLSDATSATLIVSTFNGIDAYALPEETHWTKVNNWETPLYGDDHYCVMDYITVPPTELVAGENTFRLHCESSSTGVDVNWPGPAMMVTYTGAYGSPKPPSPVLASPANNNATQPLSTTIKWHPALSASKYHVQVAKDTLFSTIILEDSTLTDTTKAITGLSPFTKYFWRVSGKNAGAMGDYSPAWTFTTYVLVPSPIFPANNATGQATNITLKWGKIAGATKYYVQLAIDSTFSGGLLVDDSTLVDSVRAVSGLSYNTQYFWHVSGKTGSSFGPFSGTVNFTTLIPVPGQVTLATPGQDGVLPLDSATFTWRHQAGATKYWFEFGYDSLFQFKTVDSTLADTSKMERSLSNYHTYYWKVRAGNGGGWGAYSLTRRANTLFTGVDERQGPPTEFKLFANYPNPFNPSTHVDFEVPRESHVSVVVYNMLGETIARLVDEVKPAGYYSVTFDAGGLASGVYFYRMTAGNVTMLKKMLLMK